MAETLTVILVVCFIVVVCITFVLAFKLKALLEDYTSLDNMKSTILVVIIAVVAVVFIMHYITGFLSGIYQVHETIVNEPQTAIDWLVEFATKTS